MLFLPAVFSFLLLQAPEPHFSVTAGTQAVDLHTFPLGAFATLEFTSPVDVEVRTAFDVRWAEVRPKSAGIQAVIGADQHSIRFRVNRALPLTLECNNDLKRVLHLFFSPPEKNPPAASAPNTRYFAAGMHEAGLIELKDGETLYLAKGAWVKGAVRIVGARGAAILGRGILDGTALPPRARNMIYAERTEGLTIQGITIFNSPGWTVLLRNSRGARIDGVNILNPAPHYGTDGFDLVSSTDVVVENAFVRTNDDCVAIKNLDDVPMSNITVRKSVFWNMPVGGNALEIGFELRGAPLSKVRFEDIDIIRVERGAAISIHNGDAATVDDVVFDNIRVENASRKLIDFAVLYAQYGVDRPAAQEERRRLLDPGGAWDGHLRATPAERVERAKNRGHIRNVLVRNLHVVEGALPYSVIAGFDAGHLVENVTIEGLRYLGRPLRTPAEAKLVTEHATAVRFR
ncbi:MAG TPA: hypothetical protein DEH78_08355 [Solibacterales bacterium]|nr:hypothetical protein [Bryobacterales bacterium]